MSVIRCAHCEREIDTDFDWTSDDGLCAFCDENYEPSEAAQGLIPIPEEYSEQ